MGHKTFWTFLITSIALVMVTLDNLVVTTAIPVIRNDLGASLESLEWTVNAYTLTFAVLLLTGAALGDRFGRRRLFVDRPGIFTAASAFAALAPSIEALNVARALQGVGGAIVTPLTLTLLSAAVPAERRGLALGAWGGIGGLAVALGPLVGGAVVQGISWQWIFWLNVPIGLALIPLAWRRLDESYGPSTTLDLPRPRAREHRPARDRLGSRPRQRRRLGEPRRSSARWSSGAALVALFVVWEQRARRADAADAVLPQPDVRAGERRLAPDVLRDVRLDLPARAVLPDGAGLLAARVGSAHPAVDGDADLRRSDRRSAVGPDPRPADHGRGARAAGDRARLDRSRLDADRRRTRSSSGRSCSPGSAWGSSSRRWRTSSSAR